MDELVWTRIGSTTKRVNIGDSVAPMIYKA